MFKAMGVNWAGTLLGCVALVLVPIPVLFYYYGHKLRERSAFAPTGPLAVQHPPINENDEEAATSGSDLTAGSGNGLAEKRRSPV
jgi:DHA1 family multidrug resistance protein-like MFS transporter